MTTVFKGLVVICAASSLALGDELLVNAGFETGDFSGWTVGGTASSGVATAGTPLASSFTPNVVDVHSGAFAAFGIVRTSPPVALTLSQTIAVVPGTDYSVGFFLSNGSSHAVGYDTGPLPTDIEIFADGVGLLPVAGFHSCPACLDVSTVVPWYEFASSFNSGLNSTETIEFQIIASGTGFVGLSADDFFVNGPSPASVPEPTSVALLATAVGVTVWRLRRSSKSISHARAMKACSINP